MAAAITADITVGPLTAAATTDPIGRGRIIAGHIGRPIATAGPITATVTAMATVRMAVTTATD